MINAPVGMDIFPVAPGQAAECQPLLDRTARRLMQANERLEGLLKGLEDQRTRLFGGRAEHNTAKPSYGPTEPASNSAEAYIDHGCERLITLAGLVDNDISDLLKRL